VKTENRIYLDHNATSPLRPEVCEEIKSFLGCCDGNPSSIHTSGRDVRRRIDMARENVARLINAKPSEIIFTSGGVEANHLAWQVFQKDKKRIATTVTEHSCVLGAAEHARDQTCDVHEIQVHDNGTLTEQELEKLQEFKPDFISLHHANNETGALYDLPAILEPFKDSTQIHTDAVQTVGKIPVDVQALGVNYLTLSGHKLGALQGIGALFVRKGAPYESLWSGGSQERGRRTGTENVLGILSLGKVCEVLSQKISGTSNHYAQLRDRFEDRLQKNLTGVHITAQTHARVPNTSHMIFEGIDAQSLLVAADLEGLEFSTGAACHSGAVSASHVILSMGYHQDTAKGAARFSVGWNTTEADIDRATEIITQMVHHIRKESIQRTKTA